MMKNGARHAQQCRSGCVFADDRQCERGLCLDDDARERTRTEPCAQRGGARRQEHQPANETLQWDGHAPKYQ
jgi:hypothetical protein